MDINRAIYALGTLGGSEGAIRESLASQLPGRVDGPADAYRHILLAAELTRRFGEDFARMLLDLHEATGNNGGQTSAAEAMDRINNEIGVDLGGNAESWRDVVSRSRNEFSEFGRANWLPASQWGGNPQDENGNRIPMGDSRLNWPISWPANGKPYSNVDYFPGDGNINDFTLGDPFTGMPWPGSTPDSTTNTNYREAKAWRPRDPLALDLDGDGIETVGINPQQPIYFDSDADGMRTATGWVRPDDGLLVLDLNGNGQIDSGRELFGDATLIQSTKWNLGDAYIYTHTATDGFQALAARDANADGQITASDAVFSQLQVWRDLNQDGISQVGELQSLGALGINSIGVLGTSTGVNLGNGNTEVLAGSYTRTDGSTAQVGAVTQQTASLNLANNPFYSQFTDNPAPTIDALALPQMQGSGRVRDLRSAMSLGTAQATELQAAVAAFVGAANRDGQQLATLALLQQWAETSDMYAAPSEVRPATQTVLSDTAEGITYRIVGSTAQVSGGQYLVYEFPSDIYREQFVTAVGVAYRPNAAGNEVLRRLAVLEAFNGEPFIEQTVLIPHQSGGSGGGGGGGGSGGSSGYLGTAMLADAQADLINAAYEALTRSVFDALSAQTRLAAYMDEVQLVIGPNGVSFDVSGLAAKVDQALASHFLDGLKDLVDLNRIMLPTLQAVGYDGIGRLRQALQMLAADSSVWAQLQDAGLVAQPQEGTWQGSQYGDVLLGSAGDDHISGHQGNDVLDGDLGNDYIVGGEGADTSLGGAGDDYLSSEAGADVLDGGAGNDMLVGGDGADVYRFGRGAGQDTISNYDYDSVHDDAILMGPNVSENQIWLQKSGADLTLTLFETGDQITVQSWYSEPAYQVGSIELNNGRRLLASDVDALVNAMAVFSPPPAGQTTLPTDYQAALSPVLSANWR